jgi:hypothetical protein
MQDSQRRAMFAKRKVPSAAKFNALIKDEAAATREYFNYGFIGLSKDEARHRRFLIKEKAKRL